jgi:hypothetical protein
VPALRISVGQAAAGQPETAQAEAGPPLIINYNRPPFPQLNFSSTDHAKLFEKHKAEKEAVYNTAKTLWEDGECSRALAALRKHERDHQAGLVFSHLRRTAEEALGIAFANDEVKKQLSLSEILQSFLRRQTQTAITRETTVRRIPDHAGEELIQFKDGQPVLVTTTSKIAAQHSNDFWFKATSNDDKRTSGWVLESSLIFY